MHTFTTDNKTISIFPCSESESPVIYLNTFLDEGQKVYEAAQAAGCPPFTLVAISDLEWNHDMVPWDSPPAFKNAEPCTGGADEYLRLLTEEIIPATERELPRPPGGGGSPGILWQVCLRCMPSARQISFPGWAACPVPSGFPVWKSISSPMNRSGGQIVCTFPWVTRRANLETKSCGMSGRTQKRFRHSIRPRGSTRCFSWTLGTTTTMQQSALLQAFVGSWAGELGPPPARLYSLYRRVKNWYAWLKKTTCFSASAEVQYPKPEHEKEPLWTGGGSGCRAWSRRALWPHVWPQTAPEHSETVELRAAKSERNVAEMVKNY